MEWKLINIRDAAQTKTGAAGIVTAKFTGRINLALHGHIQTILITGIEFKLGNIKSLIDIFPISKQYSSQNFEEEKEQQAYFGYGKDSLKDKLGKISMGIPFKRKILEVSFHKNSGHPVLFHAARSVSQKEYEETLEETDNEN